jgi:hypothetical protein
MSERIDCGLSVISDEDLRARDIEHAGLHAAAGLVRRIRRLFRWLTRARI